jgi:Domain of unknown function (DUF4062)
MTTRVMISSTGSDLADYRQAAVEVCNRLGLEPVAMEFFEARGHGATEASKQKLADADVYVGMFAYRYGYVEAGYDRSVTEVEFDHAGELGLERLCFVVDPSYPWPPQAVDANREHVEALKQRIGTTVTWETFTTVDDYRAKLQHALTEWKRRTEAADPDAGPRVAAARCLEHLQKIQLARNAERADMLENEVYLLGEKVDLYAEAIARAADSRARELHYGLLDRMRPVVGREFGDLDRLINDAIAATR